MADIRPKWNNIARRMQGEASKQAGYAMLSIQVLVGPSGDPVYWFEPKLRRIEPMRDSTQFIDSMFSHIEDCDDCV